MIMGSIFDLRKPDAVIMDLEGYELLWPGEEPRIGKRFEMNDHVAEIVGICKASRTFQTFPVVYTRYTQALEFVPPERKVLSFILAQGEPGLSVDEVCRRIEEQTGLRAVTGQQFEWITMWYFMRKTGIPFNFGITVLLGFIVGTAIAAQTFYLFTIENIKQYGALKAMGAGNWSLMGMILLQAMLVSVIGFGLGIGAATWFGTIATAPGSQARVLHAAGSVYRHGAGGRRDQHFFEPVQYAAGDGRRAGRRVSRVMRDERRQRTTADRLPRGREDVRQRQRRSARAARRGSRRLPGRDHDARRPQRLRQDDAALDRGRDFAADERQRDGAGHRSDAVVVVASHGVSPHECGLRVSAIQFAAGADGGRERGGAARDSGIFALGRFGGREGAAWAKWGWPTA